MCFTIYFLASSFKIWDDAFVCRQQSSADVRILALVGMNRRTFSEEERSCCLAELSLACTIQLSASFNPSKEWSSTELYNRLIKQGCFPTTDSVTPVGIQFICAGYHTRELSCPQTGEKGCSCFTQTNNSITVLSKAWKCNINFFHMKLKFIWHLAGYLNMIDVHEENTALRQMSRFIRLQSVCYS
jgi:hypothetical protein